MSSNTTFGMLSICKKRIYHSLPPIKSLTSKTGFLLRNATESPLIASNVLILGHAYCDALLERYPADPLPRPVASRQQHS